MKQEIVTRNMDTYMKAKAIDTVGSLTIRLCRGRKICKGGVATWVAATECDVAGDGMLDSISGFGTTPEEAVEDAWSQIESLPSGRRIMPRKNARAYRWNGFMFEEVSKDEAS